MADINKWKELNKQYEAALREKITATKNKPFKVEFDIVEWELAHYKQNKLDKEREVNFDLQFLKELTVWKQRRGKFRPKLESLIWKNEANEAATNKTLNYVYTQVKYFKNKNWNLDDIRKLVNSLIELSGVGIATASAILSIMDDRIPLMSDEAVEFIINTTSRKRKLTYTWTTYCVYYEGITKLTRALKKLDGGEKQSKITPSFCERAICAARWLKLDLPECSSLLDGNSSDDESTTNLPRKQKRTI